MTRFIILSFCAGITSAGDAYLPSSRAGGGSAHRTHICPAATVSRGRHALTEAVAFRLAPSQRKAHRDSVTVLKPARVFDGAKMHEGWIVVVRGDKLAGLITREQLVRLVVSEEGPAGGTS